MTSLRTFDLKRSAYTVIENELAKSETCLRRISTHTKVL